MTHEAEIILKQPLGTLIEGTPEKTIAVFRKIAGERIVCVGDVVFEELSKARIPVMQAIFDGATLRKKLKNVPRHDITVTNPKSRITRDLIEAIRAGHERILVEGEEDLATLPAVLYAPEGSQVIYGQPNAGLVVIIVNENTRRRVKEIMSMFEEDTHEV